jgi:2-polyprenyl-3-methyl-5-hydroxy-6-metoxy-1,4-benzoquinol methylase
MIDFDVMERCLPADAEYGPLLAALYVKNGWLLDPMLEMLDASMLPEYFLDVADVWRTLQAVRRAPPQERIDEAVRGLRFHSLEFLKRQIQFAKTGRYQASDADAICRDIYQVDETMQRYLDGLLLTYIAWPNHYRMLKWYRDAYLKQGSYGRCLEVGPGHGFLALEQLRASELNSLTALDISPHAVDYTRRVLQAHCIAPSRYDVRVANAQQGLDSDIRCFDRIVLAEVIEHVADPAGIVRSLVERSHPRTLWFITTVVNVEAPDHIYLFRSLGEVRNMLGDCGLTVTDELDMPLKMNLDLKEPAHELALVCRPCAAIETGAFDDRLGGLETNCG